MAKTKKTNADIGRFIQIATYWQQQPGPQEIRLEYAIQWTLKSCRKASENAANESNRLDIEHALTDEKGLRLLTQHNGVLSYDKAGMHALNTAKNELINTEVEIDVYFAKPTMFENKVVPFNLNPFQREAFAGFVIPEMKEPT